MALRANQVIRNVLITGASSGIGRELARLLVRDHSVRVFATARREQRLQELAQSLPEGKLIYLAGDLSDASFRERLWKSAIELDGGVDVLVNNAGLGNYSTFADQSPEAMRAILETNVSAVFDLSQKAIRYMTERGFGQIVQISSILGFFGAPYSAVYTASKHAINGFTRAMAYELAGTGVCMWSACPGRTESEFHAAARGESNPEPTPGRGQPTELVARRIARAIMSRRRRLFYVPTWQAWALVQLAAWLPKPFEWAVQLASPRAFAGQLIRPNDDSRSVP